MEIKKGDVVLDTISGQSVVVYDEIKEGYIVTLNNGDMAQIAKDYDIDIEKYIKRHIKRENRQYYYDIAGLRHWR